MRSDESTGDRDPAALRSVAAEFESLLVAQMLRSFREASEGEGSGSTEDQAGAIMTELAEQQLARVLASQGGLGLADLVVQGLSHESTDSESTILQSGSASDKE
jgi:flagellar protein FlgJ